MPPRHSRAVLAAGLAVAYSLALLGDAMLYVFLPSHPSAAGITAASLGIVLSANRVVRLAANGLSGLVSDRVGRRPPYLVGMTLALASTAGYLIAGELWSLLVWRVVWGIAFSLISVGGTAIMLDLATPADRGRTIGTYQSLVQLGSLLGFILCGVLTDVLGYRGTLAVYVPLTALGLAVAAWVLRAPRATPSPARAAAARAHPPRATGNAGTLASLRRLDPSLLAPAYVNLAGRFAGGGILMATLGAQLARLAGGPGGAPSLVGVASITGLLLAVGRLVSMIEAPLAGRLLDRSPDRRGVAAVGIAAAAVGYAVLALGDSLVAVIAGVLLVAAGDGLLHPAVVVWTADGAPPHLRGVVMGGLATAGDLGAAVGPLVGYALLARGGPGLAYALCAGLLGSALLALAAARPARVAAREPGAAPAGQDAAAPPA